MSKFLNLYDSFDEFYNSFFQGNEVEFLYNGDRYCILPVFDDFKNVCGVLIGKENDEHDLICKSKEELYYSQISNTFFGAILHDVDFVWNNLRLKFHEFLNEILIQYNFDKIVKMNCKEAK